jgi:hypothetical protein
MIKDIIVFANGLLAVCDDRGEQMPEFQGRYSEVVERLRREDLSAATIEAVVWSPNHVKLTPAEFLGLLEGPAGQLVKKGVPYGHEPGRDDSNP